MLLSNREEDHMWSYTGKEEGKHVVVLAGLHGDELVGVRAQEELRSQIESHRFLLQRGRLTLILGNPRAVRAGVRKVRFDMNRIFCDDRLSDAVRASAEFTRVHIIKSLLAQFPPDYVLDLHNTSSSSPPFSITLEGRAELPSSHELLLKQLPTEYWTHGWRGVIHGTAIENIPMNENGIAVVVECGANNDPHALRVARASIYRLLLHSECIDRLDVALKDDALPHPKGLQPVHLEQVSQPNVFHFSSKVHAFASVRRGQELAVSDGRSLLVEPPHQYGDQFRVLFPANPEALTSGQQRDAYFLAVEESLADVS